MIGDIDNQEFSEAHEALERLRRASDRGTGCHLTADMIASLELTIVGQMWREHDPRVGKDERESDD